MINQVCRQETMKSIRNQLKNQIFFSENKDQSLKTNQQKHDHADTKEQQKVQYGECSSPKQKLMKQFSFPTQKSLPFEEEWICTQYIGNIECQIQKFKGQGGHALVKVCEPINARQGNDKTYAVKIFRTGDPEFINTIKATFNINRILLDSPLICKAYELYIDENKETAHQVMQYHDYPSLEFYLLKKKLSTSIIQKILKNLALSVQFMHSKGIAHRDLKPDNILIKIQYQKPKKNHSLVDFKIIDFGVSHRFLHKTRNHYAERDMWTRTGTIFYQAPEIFEAVCYGKEVDIWSIGVIAYQMLCNKLPFQCDSIMDTITLISEETDSFEKQIEFKILQPLEQDLLRRLLKKDPTKRLTAAEIILHPWLSIQTDHQQSRDDGHIRQIQVQDDYLTRSNAEFKFNGAIKSIQVVGSPQSFFKEEITNELTQQFNEKQHEWDFTDHIHYVKKNQISSFSLFKVIELPMETQQQPENRNNEEQGYLSNIIQDRSISFDFD